MFLFYSEKKDDQYFYLTKDECAHVSRVLRKKVGDTIMATNGKGSIYKGAISYMSKKEIGVDLESSETFTARPKSLSIALAPTKNRARIETFVEKVTEIGVEKIHFVKTKNSERTEVKIERLLKLSTSAMKQSRQAYLPQFFDMIKLEDWIRNLDPAIGLLLCHETSGSQHLGDALGKLNNNEIVILIGPEGDFSPDEIELLHQHNFQSVHLGKTRLRTETAGIYAASIFNYKLG